MAGTPTRPTDLPVDRRKPDVTIVFVDLDGTLVDYDRAVRSAFAAFVAANPAWRHVDAGKAAATWLNSRRGHRLDGAVPLEEQRISRMTETAVALGVACDEAAATAWSGAVTADAVERCRLFPDVGPFLDSAGDLGLVTNGDAGVQRAKLIAAGVDPGRFRPFVASVDVRQAKPAPSIYRTAAERAGTDPSACSMIGDSRTADVEAAMAAGFRAAILVDRSADPHPSSVRTLGEALERLQPARNRLADDS